MSNPVEPRLSAAQSPRASEAAEGRPCPPEPASHWAHAVVEHALDVLTVIGPDGRILYDSPSVRRVLGYAQGELVGRNAFELIHPDDLPAALELLMATAAAPGRVSSLIFRFLHRSGAWRYLESVGAAVPDAASLAVVVNSRDVTDQVHARRAYQKGREELEERVRSRSAEVEELQLEMLRRLAQAAELRDDETGSHTRRVATLAAALARVMGVDEETALLIERTAPLHDIGKIGVPDAILRKPGPLTPAEMEVMRTHTVVGGRILAGGRSPLLRTAELVALHHHERWDGGGYPHGLGGAEIPLPARIVAVADFFDALTHDRAYRPALPADHVAGEVARGAGSHFDPDVAEAFLLLVP